MGLKTWRFGNKRAGRALFAGMVLMTICVVVLLFSLNTGTIKLSPMQVLRTLLGLGTAKEETVLFDYRMPRILITMLAGIGLGISGSILQGIFRNPLADPGVVGLNAGSAVGLVIFVSFFQSLEAMSALLIPLFTFSGALLTAILIGLLSYERNQSLQPARVILVGIAVAAGLSALTLFLSLRLDSETYTFAARWLVGNVWSRSWVHVIALLPWIVGFGIYAQLQARSLNALALGDETVISIGLSLQRKRIGLLIAAVSISSASVAMAGGIGFIGFVAPHLARRLVGVSHQYVIPISGMLGLVILVLADTAGRTLFLPSQIPAGVLVAAIGAPYFLYLLLRKS
ncbi:FecCD family ABC transporter permease [Paenibacillus sp. JDR-2]|uniref:FecCD family ABC transporter permease n=1 Tax=Paenibacillus sp. (strain JDR-2) TaxID=324057 RepID=UPI000166AFBA|nr:transport system permease protein [Paenibacillus sp. JDR-2]